jgi:S-adenosylmethionine decarboxylase proenzyme
MMMQNGTTKGIHQQHQLRRGQQDGTTRNGAVVEGDDVVYQVRMSKRFVVLSLLSCTLLAFAVGRTARMVLIVNPQRRVFEMQSALQRLDQEKEREALASQGPIRRDVMDLPNPVLKNRPVPQTVYTAMNFDTARSATITSRFVVSAYDDTVDADRPDGAACPSESPTATTTKAAPTGTPTVPDGSSNSSNHEDDEVHLPAGQHLLMDIRNVQSAFLASEERLASAMLDVVGSCGLTLLSYHCHGLQPNGVSCVGVLLESHVSFHTWPSKGVITLDLFTCGSQSLLPIVSKVERLFGIPATPDGPETVWAYKVRGFGEETQEELTDLFTFPIGFMTEYKKELLSTIANRQRIDVYDVLRPVYQTYQAYKKSVRDDDSYEAQYKHIFEPDRILFLNGVLQARRSAEIPYHEALVHPAMFAHKNPRRVLLLNCAGGAALREVLKHNTVETVVMVEEDEAIVNISRQMFPEFHDCSAFLGDTGDRICSDDPRVEIVYRDLFDWASSQDGIESKMAGFDVVILDDM